MNTRAEKCTDIRLAARCAAIASVGAALIHLAAAPMHWGTWALAGVFFVATAAFQAAWAHAAWTQQTALVLGAGVVVNVAIAALWIASTTVGLSFGPHAGQREAVEGAGICALLLECYIVMGAAWAWFRGTQAEHVSGVRTALVLLGANGVIAVMVALGLTAVLHGDHQHGVTPGVTEAHGVVTPPSPSQPVSVGEALPVTDMGLETDGHAHQHGE